MINTLNVLCIIQARMASKRLPKKALVKLNGKPAIIRMIKRIEQSKYINKIILATGISSENDILEKVVKKSTSSYVFRGDDDDVLSRYVEISKKYKADIIVRLTGDCPLTDFDIIDNIIRMHVENKADYTSNILNRTFPDGLDVEVFNLDTLLEANRVSTNSF